MAGNTIGTLLQLTTFGESHGSAVGGILDGMPPNILIDHNFIAEQISRRATGRNPYSSQRMEADKVEFLSGIWEGMTSGAPIAFQVRNQDQQSSDYSHLKDVFRPGHADITYALKYGIRDYRGGGRASARETLSWVIAGSIVFAWLRTQGIEITAYVSSIGDIRMPDLNKKINRLMVIDSSLGCPDPFTTQEMEKRLAAVAQVGDTLGGVITATIEGLPPGLGEPVFGKFHADMGKACLSLNAVKAFEIGEGFESSAMLGSHFKDSFERLSEDGMPQFKSNRAGGVLGGITTGQPFRFRLAFKPISSTQNATEVMREDGTMEETKIHGRHDVCPVPRAIPIVESLAALVCGDHLLRMAAYRSGK